MVKAAQRHGIAVEKVQIPSSGRRTAIERMVSESVVDRYVLIWSAAVDRSGPMGRHAVAAFNQYVYDCDLCCPVLATEYPYLSSVTRMYRVYDSAGRGKHGESVDVGEVGP
jgi:hypothetical protein